MATQQGDTKDSQSDLSVFLTNYKQCREDWLRLSATVPHSEVVSLRVGEAQSLKGPDGEDLFVDILVVRCAEDVQADGEPSTQPSSVFVHTCGLHGVEGYVGSAIQRHLLQQPAFLQQLAQLQRGQMAVIAHALNPHGMAWWERFNENNVDLNRNCVTVPGTAQEDAQKFQQLTSQPYTEYRELDGLMNPPAIGACDCFPMKAACAIMQYGIPHLKRASVSGQHVKQEGIFYGGASLQESVELFLRQLHALGVNRSNPNLSTLTHIDVHSGLGESAQESLLIGPGSPAELLRVCVGVPGEGSDTSADPSRFKVQPTRTDGVSYPMYGTLNAAVSLLAGPLPPPLLATAVPAAEGMAGEQEFAYPPPSPPTQSADSNDGDAADADEHAATTADAKGAAGGEAEAGTAPVSRGHDCVKMCLAQEFGTLPPADVLRALRALNSAMYGASAPGSGVRAEVAQNAQERAAVLAAFFVDTVEWKTAMLRKGEATCAQLMAFTFDGDTQQRHLSAVGASQDAGATTTPQGSPDNTGEAKADQPSGNVHSEPVQSASVGASEPRMAEPAEGGAPAPAPGAGYSEYEDAIRAVQSSATQGSVMSADRTAI